MALTETTLYDELELTRFERVVDIFSTLMSSAQDYTFIGVILGGSLSVFCWFIFRYHYHKLEDDEFFKDNIAVAGRFTFKTFDTLRWCGMTMPPVAMFVLFFSFWTRFDSVKFIKVSGIKRIKS